MKHSQIKQDSAYFENISFVQLSIWINVQMLKLLNAIKTAVRK